MYFDLNVPWPTAHLGHLAALTSQKKGANAGAAGGPKDKGKGKARAREADEVDVWAGVEEEVKNELRQRVECAIRLGYSAIAFNLYIPQTLDPTLLAPHFPFPPTRPPFPDLDPRTAQESGQTGRERAKRGEVILQLSRLTVVMDDRVVSGKGTAALTTGYAAYLGRFDLLAGMPTDAASFSHACLALSTPNSHGIDIITLDLSSSPRLPFFLPLHTVSKALADKVSFEILYSSCTSLPSAARAAPLPNSFPCYLSTTAVPSASASTNHSNAARRNLVAGAKEVVRVTNGKGLVISSGCRAWSELRAADDVANLASLFGLSPEKAKRALTSNAQLVVARGRSVHKTYRGVVGEPIIIDLDKVTTPSAAPAPERIPTQPERLDESTRSSDPASSLVDMVEPSNTGSAEGAPELIPTQPATTECAVKKRPRNEELKADDSRNAAGTTAPSIATHTLSATVLPCQAIPGGKGHSGADGRKGQNEPGTSNVPGRAMALTKKKKRRKLGNGGS